MLSDDVYDELDQRLAPLDDELRRRFPGEPFTRQPVHTVYVPADRFGPGLAASYGRAAMAVVARARTAGVPGRCARPGAVQTGA